MTLEDGENVAKWLGSSDPKEQHGVEFPVFSFASYISIPEEELTKPTAQNHEWVQTKKLATKCLCSLFKGPKKKKRQKNFRSFQKITFYYIQTLRKILWPSSFTQQRPGLLPLPGYNEVLPTSLQGWCQKKAEQRVGTFIPTGCE